MRACPDNTCGFTTADDNERFCPDCGKELVAGGENPTATAIPAPPVPVEEEAPLPPPPDETLDTRPVLFTITLPDKTEKQLREGDKYTVASERCTDPADLKLPDASNPGVSSQPFLLTVENGELKVTGGGTNGYKITTVKSHAASDITVVRKGQTVVLGAKTPFRIK